MEGRPLEFPQGQEGQQPQMMDNKWGFAEWSLEGRPLEFGRQDMQITGQGGL
jgi:hypothetical protein